MNFSVDWLVFGFGAANKTKTSDRIRDPGEGPAATRSHSVKRIAYPGHSSEISYALSLVYALLYGAFAVTNGSRSVGDACDDQYETMRTGHQQPKASIDASNQHNQQPTDN